MEPYTPPRFTIDLSLPPKDRYRQLAKTYKHDMQDLTELFDDLLRDVAIPEKWIPKINSLARLTLRRVHDSAQTQELRGISEESGVPMYLLVAFNVILDLLMGCTSGGVRTQEKTASSEPKMLHFRTLDWTMDPLRQVIVQLDFVRSRSNDPNRILASSITYVGFIGVLTGVKPGLSMSLNFRGIHDNNSRAGQFRFYFHHLLVLFGLRPSISTYLRTFLIGDHECAERRSRPPRGLKRSAAPSDPLELAEVYEKLRSYHTTAAYLIFSDGNSTISIDKDFKTAKLRRSSNFIATTNHDVVEHDDTQQENAVAAKLVHQAARHAAGLEEFLDESEDRWNCITERWRRMVSRQYNKAVQTGKNLTLEDVEAHAAITQQQVIDWVSKYPTTNECTHFATVMDPCRGNIAWSLAYPEPLSQDS